MGVCLSFKDGVATQRLRCDEGSDTVDATFLLLFQAFPGACGRTDPALTDTPAPPASTLLRRREFQWFLIALSVLPGRRLLISAHLLPNSACEEMI